MHESKWHLITQLFGSKMWQENQYNLRQNQKDKISHRWILNKILNMG